MLVTLPSKEKILLEDEIFQLAEQDYYKNGVPGCSKEVHVQTFISGYCLALQKFSNTKSNNPGSDPNH